MDYKFTQPRISSIAGNRLLIEVDSYVLPGATNDWTAAYTKSAGPGLGGNGFSNAPLACSGSLGIYGGPILQGSGTTFNSAYFLEVNANLEVSDGLGGVYKFHPVEFAKAFSGDVVIGDEYVGSGRIICKNGYEWTPEHGFRQRG